MTQHILDYRVTSKKGYRLCETLDNINSDHSLNEGTSAIGKGIQKTITLAIMALLDDATGELSGFLALLPILYKNIYELNKTNKIVEKELSQSAPDLKKLEKLRKELITDVIDILNAIVLALPLPVIDTVAIPIINILKNYQKPSQD